MRTHTRLKIFFVRVLIGLGTLTTLALATGARQRSAKPNAFSGDSLSFLPAVTYSSGGSSPNYVAVADVNGDGKPDLLVANEGSSTVSVLLGNGDGTFQTQHLFATGNAPESVAVAD